jgi:hypothetical protein
MCYGQTLSDAPHFTHSAAFFLAVHTHKPAFLSPFLLFDFCAESFAQGLRVATVSAFF